MIACSIRFYAELNDFLRAELRGAPIEHTLTVSTTAGDLIESLGVPHAEVELILANGESVDLSYRVKDGDRISVFPVFESVDVTGVLRLRPRPLRQPRFIVDVHLGRLAAYLRLLGFDTLYRNDWEDAALAQASADQQRILLTRDRGLLKRAVVTRGHFVRETSPRLQLVEVLRRFDLAGEARPFSRCLVCNGVLERAEREQVEARLPPRTREHFTEFFRCSSCGRVYWKGSHYRRMERLIETALG